jgi:hypothetical protein
MDRRAFLRGLFGIAGAAAVVAIASPADALTLPAPVAVGNTPVEPAVATDKDIDASQVEDVHYRPYWHRHRYWRRRYYYRRRRHWHRRRWRRRW